MRALIGILITATALWTGYWWYGATTIESQVRNWLETQPASVAEAGDVVVQGIPNRFDLTISDLTLADPARGIRWTTPFAQVFAMTWKPWHLIASLPDGQTIALPDQVLTLNSDRMMGDVILHPSTALGLQEVVIEATGIGLQSNGGWQLGLGRGLASMREDLTRPNSYRLGLKLTDLAPDPSLLVQLGPQQLPDTIGEVYLDAYATLSAPLDRFAAQTAPKLTALRFSQVRLTWGELQFYLSGDLLADAQGMASGTLDLKLHGWKSLPPVLAAMGIITPEAQPTITNLLGALAQQEGDPDVVEMQLKASEGLMTLGPFPLGPAPRFY